MADSVLLALSGGVDSTASAVILKERGYDIKALYFDVLKDGDDAAYSRAAAAAERLGTELLRLNVSRLFDEKVISYFVSEYEKGRTPSPCVICNPMVKFAVLCEQADRLGCRYIATGHYAGIERSGELFRIKKAADKSKDQSYMLYMLGQDVLSRLLLPLSEVLSKDEVRSIAAGRNMPNWGEKDSQDLCFVPDGDHRAFLKSRGAASLPGSFVLEDGTALGPHDGLINYTVGQRKGLGIALGHPVFVKSLDPVSGNVILTENSGLFHKNVYVNNLYFSGLSIVQAQDLYNESHCGCKLRYTAREAACTVHFKENSLVLVFDEPQRAAAPGQPAVLYSGDAVIGGGFIEGADDCPLCC